MDEVRVRGNAPFRARLVLVCSVLALGACAPSDPPIVMPSNVNAAAIDRLIERIDVLVATLGRTPATSASLATAPVQEGERVRVADDSSALLARIEALEHSIAALHSRGPSLAASVTPRHTIGPMRQDLIGQLHAQFADKTQNESARRSLFMLTPREVVELLGMPRSTQLNDRTLWWYYSSGEKGKGISVGFLDGVVMFVGN